MHTKRLSTVDCSTLVSNVTAQIRTWHAQLLSYAGPIELVRAVIGGIQNFWSQIFCLPKKVLNLVDSACRKFIWTGRLEESKKSPVAWETMCLPKECGGLNLKNLAVWVKAAILKLLWNLENKKDRLWVRWMHSYYIKSHNLLHCPIPRTSSWCARKILQLGDLVCCYGGWALFLDSKHEFSIKKAYSLLLGEVQRVPWRKLISKNTACPKAVFTLWMSLHGRLNTATRIARWNNDFDVNCKICNAFPESQNHLFGECNFAKELWFIIFNFLASPIRFAGFEDQVALMICMAKKKTPLARTILSIWTEFIYEVWQQRNSNVFKGNMENPGSTARKIMFRVACRTQSDVTIL